MSSQRGSGPTRKRAQKFKNSFAFKNDLHDKTPQMKRINQINVCEVCEKCKAQIEWKIKYKKYKPLSQAKTCIKCNQRNVLKAYHVACKECAKREKVCAKCLKSADEVNIEPPEPTVSEQQQLKAEMDRLIKSFPERKRRTFLRFMEKGKKDEKAEQESATVNDVTEPNADKDEEAENKLIKKPTRIPHTREDLLSKIEMLKNRDSDDYDDDDDDDDDDEEEDDDEEDEEDDFNDFSSDEENSTNDPVEKIEKLQITPKSIDNKNKKFSKTRKDLKTVSFAPSSDSEDNGDLKSDDEFER